MTRRNKITRILVVGKDARTDAIAWACSVSPQKPHLSALTELRIPGLVEKCEGRVRTGSLNDTDELRSAVREFQPDLVIIGPEEPLAAGYADELRAAGIAAFGPSRSLARIESSKAWARDLLDRYDIPGNPDYRVFRSDDGLRRYMEDLGAFVVKPDGLTAGKGVRVFGEHLTSIDDALAYAGAVLAAEGQLQVEERLEGEEFSLQTITDGEHVVHCPPVQDHKRAFEGDQGPNTGGMGSYSCEDHLLPFLSQREVAEAQSINERVIDALRSDTGEPYVGVLYGGFMATAFGLRLIEYNSRFGDPEAMNVLPLLNADFVELCGAATSGDLGHFAYSFERKATVCKYIVPAAYPDRAEGRGKIAVPPQLQDADGLRWFWAACAQDGDDVYLTFSRAGAFVGIGDSLAEAETRAERAAASIAGAVRHRTDIGRSDVIARRVSHMSALRTGTAGAAPRPA